MDGRVDIKFKRLRENAIIPQYGTDHAAGLDLCAAVDEPVMLAPLARTLIPTGFAIELPEGFEAQVRARSGLSLKHGITMANGIGTIDADYRGEIGAIVFNCSDTPFTIEPGMRIAQLVIARYEKISVVEAGELTETIRGEGGYGSTGY